MSNIPIEPGRAVLSKAGRDAGRRFLALRVDDAFATIVDGDNLVRNFHVFKVGYVFGKDFLQNRVFVVDR